MSYKIHVGGVCLPAASALTLAGGAASAFAASTLSPAPTLAQKPVLACTLAIVF